MTNEQKALRALAALDPIETARRLQQRRKQAIKNARATDTSRALLEEIQKYNNRTVVSSWRVQPNIFNNPPLKPGNIFLPLDLYGAYHNDFEPDGFLEFADDFSALNDIQIRRGEGAGGYIVKKEDWDYIGGNDSLFAPTSWEDMDLFIRMQNEGFEFVQTTKSVIWHFAGRGSHRLEENDGKTSQRQRETN